MFTIFVDNIVTLHAGTPMADGHQIEAHKVILAASSPFFQAILKKNKHTHPLIYLRGMKSNGASLIETRENIVFEVVVSRPFKNISYVWSMAFGN